MIAPDQFIPLAEETGLIIQIGEWVLLTACTEAATWPAGVKVAVNLSPVQFRKSNLSEVVMYALAQSGLPPERLELEITETALMNRRWIVCRYYANSRTSALQLHSTISALDIHRSAS